MRQRAALFYIRRHEPPEGFGVVVEPMSTADALIRRKLAEEAPRLRYARATGRSLRLTAAGRDLCQEIETP